MPRLFSCCLWGSIIIVGEFVAPYRAVDRSDEIIKEFYRLSVMSVYFRLFVNNDLFDKRAQYFGREFFKTVILVNKHHKIENFIVVFFRFRDFRFQRFNPFFQTGLLGFVCIAHFLVSFFGNFTFDFIFVKAFNDFIQPFDTLFRSFNFL